MKFKSIIFDMDGTLLDSMYIWDGITEKYLESIGITPPKDIWKSVRHFTLAEAIQHIKEKFNIETPAEQMLNEAIGIISDGYKKNVQLKPYAFEFLTFLYENGVDMCIATATDRDLAEAALERASVLKYFKFIITSREAGIGKTSPKIYFDSVSKLGSSPENVVIFEDAFHCVMTAKKAGFYVVGVDDLSTRDVSPKVKEMCDCYITSYEDVLNKYKAGIDCCGLLLL